MAGLSLSIRRTKTKLQVIGTHLQLSPSADGDLCPVQAMRTAFYSHGLSLLGYWRLACLLWIFPWKILENPHSF